VPFLRVRFCPIKNLNKLKRMKDNLHKKQAYFLTIVAKRFLLFINSDKIGG